MKKNNNFFSQKKFIVATVAMFFIFVFGNFIFAEPANAVTEINAYFFWGDGCPHCEKDKEFLEYMQTKYRALKIYDFEVYNNGTNSKLLKEAASVLNIRIDGVPVVIIGDQPFIGYSEFVTPIQIENKIKECLMAECSDSIFDLMSNEKYADNDNNKKTLPSKLTTTPGGLLFLFIFGVLAVGFVVYQAKK